jgi:RimJ/RimL family protein N-acetyltransferase
MHVASDGKSRWLTRGTLAALFAYPLVQLGYRRVTSLIASRNTVSQQFCKHLGFKVEGYCRNAMKDDDVLVMGMLREDCRFIKQEI